MVVTRALRRLGGALVAPRATARAMGPKEGEDDARWMTLSFLIGSQSMPLAVGLATFAAMPNWAGLQPLLSALAWALIPALLLSVALEAVLGGGRRRFRGMLMVPFVLLASAAHALSVLGWAPPWGSLAPQLLGAAWSLVLAGVLRVSITPEPGTELDTGFAAPDSGPGRRPESLDPVGKPLAISSGLAAALLVAVVGFSGAQDIHSAASRWDALGPLGPDRVLPDFEVDLVGGGRLRSSELRGQVTLLAFWATWCGACRGEMPALEALEQQFGGSGLALYGVNMDREGDQAALVQAYAARNDLSFAMALDPGAMARAFRVSSIPHIVIIDRDGKIRHVHQGRVRESVLREEVEMLLAKTG